MFFPFTLFKEWKWKRNDWKSRSRSEISKKISRILENRDSRRSLNSAPASLIFIIIITVMGPAGGMQRGDLSLVIMIKRLLHSVIGFVQLTIMMWWRQVRYGQLSLGVVRSPHYSPPPPTTTTTTTTQHNHVEVSKKGAELCQTFQFSPMHWKWHYTQKLFGTFLIFSNMCCR